MSLLAGFCCLGHDKQRLEGLIPVYHLYHSAIGSQPHMHTPGMLQPVAPFSSTLHQMFNSEMLTYTRVKTGRAIRTKFFHSLFLFQFHAERELKNSGFDTKATITKYVKHQHQIKILLPFYFCRDVTEEGA